MSSRQQITTTCTRDCPNTCGLVATVEDGRLTGLKGAPDHPFTRGLACHKTSAYIERVYSKERIIKPLRKTSGGWQPISWDHALVLIAEKLKQVRTETGPEAVLYYQGYGERTALKLLNKYFFNLFGGVTTLRGSLCGGTGQAAQNLDYGHRISHDPLDHYHSRAMILWARNPATTNISLVPIMRHISQQSGRVIVIDPYRNRSAGLADRHIAPAPGNDGFLALAAAKIIFSHHAEDREFLVNCCTGYPGYRTLVERFSLEDLCAKAGVSCEDAGFLAHTLMEYRPTSILLGWGLHRYKNAHFTIRAIDALAATSGIIGIAGGGVSQGFEEYGPYDQTCWGDHLNPGRRTLLMPEIGREILTASDPEIRMAVITAGNPVCMAPDSEQVARALQSLEMVVYSGHFMDDTAECADLVLPATTFLEEHDIMASYGHNYVGPVNRAIDPIGECRSDFELFSGLARLFEFAEEFCLPAELWLEKIGAPIFRHGCTPAQLRQGPFRMPEPMIPYADRRFPTASGKFQLLTDDNGMQPRTSDPAYPYTLLTVAAHHHICSERTLEEHAPLPVIRLHPEEAAERGLGEDRPVLVKSAAGEMRARLVTDTAVRRDCVLAERGGWIKAGHGFNRLTTAMTSAIGDGTPYYETRVTLLSDE